MATLTSENLRQELQATEARAAEAWAKADKLRSDMIAAGADPSKGDEFEKLSTAFKAYDAERDQAEQMKAKLGELARIDGMYQGGGLPQGNRARSDERSRPTRFGDRFTQDQQYQDLFTLGILKKGGDPSAGATQAVAAAIRRPVELMSRDEVEALLQGGRIMATTITGGGSTSAGPFIQNDLQAGFIAYLRKQPTIASIVGQGTTDSDVVEYVTESAPTNNAAETAEDTAAPESAYPFATQTTNVREITHFVPVTLRAMADEGQIRTIVENNLAMDVLDRLDTELYAGGGTGQDLTGITVASGIGTFALGAYTRLDAVHRAITTVRTAAGVLLEADYVVMHPNDWQKVRLEKDSNGMYLMGPPGMSGDKQIWGVPVVVSTVATEGTICVGNFERCTTMWLREGLSVTSGLDGNDFTKRRVSLLAAMRVAFAVTRVGGICTVTSF